MPETPAVHRADPMTDPMQFFESLRGIPDLRLGLCVGDDARLWDSTSGPAVDRNIEICANCVVLERCRDWARTQGRGKLVGVVGGKLYGGETNSKKKPAA